MQSAHDVRWSSVRQQLCHPKTGDCKLNWSPTLFFSYSWRLSLIAGKALMKTQMCLRNSCDLKWRREKVNGCFPKRKTKKQIRTEKLRRNKRTENSHRHVLEMEEFEQQCWMITRRLCSQQLLRTLYIFLKSSVFQDL